MSLRNVDCIRSLHKRERDKRERKRKDGGREGRRQRGIASVADESLPDSLASAAANVVPVAPREFSESSRKILVSDQRNFYIRQRADINVRGGYSLTDVAASWHRRCLKDCRSRGGGKRRRESGSWSRQDPETRRNCEAESTIAQFPFAHWAPHYGTTSRQRDILASPETFPSAIGIF